jgi:hypothetical protein
MFLGQITERYHNYRSENFGDRWINLELLNKQFKENIIKQHTNHHEQEIAKQLYPAMQGGAGKNNIPHQEKARRETDAKGNNECRNMWFKSKNTNMQDLFVQDVVVADEKH